MAAGWDNGAADWDGAGKLSLWDTQTWLPQASREFPVARGQADLRRTIGYVAYSPDGRLLATVEPQPRPDGRGPDWLLVLRDPTTGERDGSPLHTGRGRLQFAFTPDGRSVLTSNEGGSVAMVQWNLETRRPTRTFSGDPGVIAVSPDGRLAAIGRADRTASLVDLRTKETHALSGHRAGVYNAVFSLDGNTLATTSEDGAVIVWDVGSGARREELSGHADSVMTAAFSPDGETLYTASLDGTAIAWDLSGDRRLGRALAGEATSNAGRFSPDGKLIAVGLQNGGIGLWDASSLEPRGGLDTAGPESVESVEFSPDAETLGALHGPGSATLWDVETRSLLHRWAELGRPGGIVPPVLRFSPDGTMVAVAAPTSRVTLLGSRNR